jgi:Methyltransferase domain
VETLRQTGKRLAPEGRVLVRMPTVSSHAYEEFGTSWYGLDPPRHFTLFSRDGVERLAEATGFEVVDVVDDSTAVQFWASAQNQLGIPFASERSRLIDQRRSPFSNRQIRDWDNQAQQLNASGRGDQAAWVLRPERGR